MTIYFYSTRDAHGGFSNFSRHGFTLKDTWWPTSEPARICSAVC